MKSLVLIALSPLLVASAPAIRAEDKEDLRCYLALASLNDSKDKDVQTAGAVGSQYFLGRLDGRTPSLDLEEAMAGEAPHMNEAAIQSLLKTCSKTLSTRGDQIIEIGKRLEKRGI